MTLAGTSGLLYFSAVIPKSFFMAVLAVSSCSPFGATQLLPTRAGEIVTKAKSKGIHVRLLDNLFAVLVALIVMLSIKWIGILIINALLILPAASSRNISENMREYHFFSVIFSVFSGIVGLAVSYYTNVATGPMIVIIASVIYFSTFIFGRKLKK